MRKRRTSPERKQWQDILRRISSIATALYNVLKLILFLWDKWKH